jgi:hypothetical protein
MFNAWSAEIESANAARAGRNTPYGRTAVTTVVQEHVTTTSITLADRDWRADSLQRTSHHFIEAIGGEIRPDVEAEAAFAAVRAAHVRPATAARRRTGPPQAVSEVR